MSFDSKKFKTAVIGALFVFLAAIITAGLSALGVDLDPAVVIGFLGTIASLFGVNIAAQGYADGKSGGLTSSNANAIIKLRETELEAAKAVSPFGAVSQPPQDSLSPDATGPMAVPPTGG